MAETKKLSSGTRLHLGNATSPPADEKYKDLIEKFSNFSSSCGILHAFVAVDAAPKLEDYSLVGTIEKLSADLSLEVIPVKPWGKFVAALNAILMSSAKAGASHCLFCSAETQASPKSISKLLEHMDEDTLVVGAVLQGHDYQPNSIQKLNGRTTPWNTLAIWDVNKLALTGFPLVADGIHRVDGISVDAGVEEVSAIALIQNILGSDRAKAKLVPVPDITWDQDFPDEQRRKWHEKKMMSKVERPAKHLDLMHLNNGKVEHF
mmetsp:Transcript_16716/g.25253  ORF Transcript_16716/g.25253 Transcript_16716/m.25253 type:complete len:263 (+) Transcript_16716:143-931(+)